MPISLNKSSLLAAIEIINDKNFLKYKNLNYLESYKTTLDVKSGKGIIDIVGIELLENFTKSDDIDKRKYILRQILSNYLKKAKPGYLFRITGGRTFFLKFISENFEQLLREAGLLDKLGFDKESENIQKWWDEISEFVRKLDKSIKLELGRSGEKKTMVYEKNRLKKSKINKEPSWDSFENNLLGYDVQSWKNNAKKIFIEVKASSYANGMFFLTRGEWNFAQSVKDYFIIHLWVQNKKSPRIITFKELNSNNYRIEDKPNAEWQDIKITPLSLN